MKRLFPGSFKPSREEMMQMWDDCLLILDSSVFISLYNRSKDEVEHIISLLKSNEHLLWIPYQAAKEYLDKRAFIISEKIQECEDFKRAFDGNVKRIVSMMRAIRNPILNEMSESIESLNPVVSRFHESIEKKLEDYVQDKEDSILENLSSILDGERIGNPASYVEIERLEEEAERRAAFQLPPFTHEEEAGLQKYSSLLQWNQILIHLKKRMRPALFITADHPHDWWLKVDEQSYTARSELINELNSELRITFHIIDINTFISIAEEVSRARLDTPSEQIVDFKQESAALS